MESEKDHLSALTWKANQETLPTATPALLGATTPALLRATGLDMINSEPEDEEVEELVGDEWNGDEECDEEVCSGFENDDGDIDSCKDEVTGEYTYSLINKSL